MEGQVATRLRRSMTAVFQYFLDVLLCWIEEMAGRVQFGEDSTALVSNLKAALQVRSSRVVIAYQSWRGRER